MQPGEPGTEPLELLTPVHQAETFEIWDARSAGGQPLSVVLLPAAASDDPVALASFVNAVTRAERGQQPDLGLFASEPDGPMPWVAMAADPEGRAVAAFLDSLLYPADVAVDEPPRSDAAPATGPAPARPVTAAPADDPDPFSVRPYPTLGSPTDFQAASRDEQALPPVQPPPAPVQPVQLLRRQARSPEAEPAADVPPAVETASPQSTLADAVAAVLPPFPAAQSEPGPAPQDAPTATSLPTYLVGRAAVADSDVTYPPAVDPYAPHDLVDPASSPTTPITAQIAPLPMPSGQRPAAPPIEPPTPPTPPMPQTPRWPVLPPRAPRRTGPRSWGTTRLALAGVLALIVVLSIGGVTAALLVNDAEPAVPGLAAVSADYSPLPQPSPRPYPSYRTDVPQVIVTGPVWQPTDSTRVWDYPGWPFAFRTSVDMVCDFWMGRVDYKAFQCGQNVAPRRAGFTMVVRRCAEGCSTAERARFETMLPWSPEVELADRDATTRFGVAEGERRQLTMLHYFATAPGEPLSWVVIFQGGALAEDWNVMLKTANDIRSQTP
jgi:hypothetical protein